MKTYINIKGQSVSVKPDIFKVGTDYFGQAIYNNDTVYHFSEIVPRFEILRLDFEGYQASYFDSAVKVFSWQITELLTYLAQLFQDKLFRKLSSTPEIGETVILSSHNSAFKVLDNTAVLFIKVQSLNNPDWIDIQPIHKFHKSL